ncbi:MAG: type II toxin-antitoxin system HipA family toxin [Fibrobacterales bacterium]
MVDVALVKIWGEDVGAVRWDKERQVAIFEYDKKFISKGYELSPMKMPLDPDQRIFQFPALRKQKNEDMSTFKGLPGLLADALPDRYGNQLIDLWLAQNDRPMGSMNPVEQLCFIGKRGMGALEFEPVITSANTNSFSIELQSLVESASKLLSHREGFNTNLHEDEKKAMSDILKIGTSAGGARPKAVITYNSKTGDIRSGQANAPKGYEHWLIKLDGVSDAQFGVSHGFGRVEYAYYLMAKECGINMMESKLIEENGRAHFMTKRFDRGGNNTKHHIQTFCGIQHFDYKNLQGHSYEQLFQTMRLLKLSYPEAKEMFRRMVFNAYATNYDDHTKNFAFMLKQGEMWKLSPAYDICYSYDPTNIWVSQHTLSINGKYHSIIKEDLMTIAEANNIKKADKIISDIKEVVSDWEHFASIAEVNKNLKSAISKNILI